MSFFKSITVAFLCVGLLAGVRALGQTPRTEKQPVNITDSKGRTAHGTITRTGRHIAAHGKAKGKSGKTVTGSGTARISRGAAVYSGRAHDAGGRSAIHHGTANYSNGLVHYQGITRADNGKSVPHRGTARLDPASGKITVRDTTSGRTRTIEASAGKILKKLLP